jgi:membrane associated rhomboid family serine protease
VEERAAEIVRSSSDRAAMERWTLVLVAAGIPHEVDEVDGALRLLVPALAAGTAAAELAAFDREEEPLAPEPVVESEWGETAVGVVLALLLVVWFRLTEPGGPGWGWHDQGAAVSDAIRHGELWLTVTALTLHHDAAHLLGNLVGSCLFVTALGRQLGPGVAAALILAAGAGGNLAAALVRGGGHVTVGASTSVFGAVGALGALQAVRRRGRRGAWIPVAGSLALLAMLGTGERADFLGHLLGLAVGAVLGALAGVVLREPPAGRAQAALVLVALGVVVGCWLAALA